MKLSLNASAAELPPTGPAPTTNPPAYQSTAPATTAAATEHAPTPVASSQAQGAGTRKKLKKDKPTRPQSALPKVTVIARDAAKAIKRKKVKIGVAVPPTRANQPGAANAQSVEQTSPKRAIVAVRQIVVDKSIQCREVVNESTVEEYRERMKAGDKFPALVVFKVEGKFVLVDGLHRYLAAKKAGLKRVEAEVHSGTTLDALKYALEANATHGLPRTAADKHRAATLALSEFGKISDRLIAEMLHVSPTFIGKVRSQLSTVDSSTSRTGRDNKTRKLPKKPEPAGPGTSSTVLEKDTGVESQKHGEEMATTGAMGAETGDKAASAGLEAAMELVAALISSVCGQFPGDASLIARHLRLMAQNVEHRATAVAV